MTELEQIKVTKPTRKEKGEVKDRMKNMMMFLPNMVKLLGNLLKDARVPTAEKALFIGAIVYVISPIDLIPDVLPFIGQVDDLYVVALTLLRLLNRTDESVVRQHWSGGGDIVGLANSVAKIAPMLLPKRISRVISSEVELAPTGKALNSLAKNKQPLVIEIPQPEDIKVDSQSALPN